VWAACAAGLLLVASAWAFRAGGDEKPKRSQPLTGSIVVDGSTTVGPIAKALRDYFREVHPEVTVTVGESGSGIGATALINGTCDVADMSRFMKDTEFRAAVEKKVLPVAHAIAMDGIAVVVHPSNPVERLTLAQLRDIYSGKIKNWHDVGGPDLEMVKVSRDTNSGTYETFESLVMAGTALASDTEHVGSNGQARTRVTTTPAAIGYVGLGFVKGLKALAIDGVRPTKQTVATGEYPISRPLFMFTNGYPKPGTALHAFVTAYLTREGQAIVESVGFVPVTDY